MDNELPEREGDDLHFFAIFLLSLPPSPSPKRKEDEMETIGRVVLRRFLKERLGKVLATDLDLAQLSISLKNGSAELKECLLDADYLNEQLVRRGGRITAQRDEPETLTLPAPLAPALPSPPTSFCRAKAPSLKSNQLS